MIDLDTFSKDVFWYFNYTGIPYGRQPEIPARAPESARAPEPGVRDSEEQSDCESDHSSEEEEALPKLEDPNPDDLPPLEEIPPEPAEDDPPCGNCDYHGFPCMNCMIPGVDGPGFHEGTRVICREEPQEILDILLLWLETHPYVPVRVINTWEEL